MTGRSRFLRTLIFPPVLYLLTVSWWSCFFIEPLQPHSEMMVRIFAVLTTVALIFVSLTAWFWREKNNASEKIFFSCFSFEFFPSALFALMAIYEIYENKNISLALLYLCFSGCVFSFKTSLLLLAAASVFSFIEKIFLLFLEKYHALFAHAVLKKIFSMAGLKASASDNLLYVNGNGWLLDAWRSGAVFIFTYMSAAMVGSLLVGRRRRILSNCEFLSAGLLVHLAQMSFMVFSYPVCEPTGVDVFSRYFMTGLIKRTLPFIVLAGLLFWRVLPEDEKKEEISSSIITVFPGRVSAGRAIFSALLAGMVLFLQFVPAFEQVPVGCEKKLQADREKENKEEFRIIFDEAHGGWESVIRESNFETPPPFAENTYWNLGRLLSRGARVYALVRDTAEGEIAANGVRYLKYLPGGEVIENFGQGDIIILKCPTIPYSEEEIQRYEKFVERGGGLFLIGDHTDVFFMNTILNSIATRFGIRFNLSSVYFVDGCWIATTKRELLPGAPYGLPKNFLWANGDTLSLESSAVPFIFSPPSSFSEPMDFYKDNFFGNQVLDSTDPLGRFPVLAGAKKGNGRVAVFTDSTCFNNLLLYTPGRLEMLVSILDWLRGKENCKRWLHIKILLAVLVAGAGLFFFLFMKTCSAVHYAFVLLPVLVINCFSLYGQRAAEAAFEARLERFRAREVIALDCVHGGRRSIATGNGYSITGREGYQDFLLDLSRMRLPLQVLTGKSLSENLSQVRLLFAVTPTLSYTRKELEEIEKMVKNGGTLVIIDGPERSDAAFTLAAYFGFQIRRGPMALDRGQSLFQCPTIVDGGEKILASLDGFPVVSLSFLGRGKVIVIGDDGLFAGGDGRYRKLGITGLVARLVEDSLDGTAMENFESELERRGGMR